MGLKINILICLFVIKASLASFLDIGIFDKKSYIPLTKDVVKNVENCGGLGKLVQMRYRGCSDPDHCRTPDVRPSRLGVLGLLEVEFVPSKNIKSLGYQVTTNSLNFANAEGYETYESVVSQSSVLQDRTYVFRTEEYFPIWSSFYTFQIALYNNDTREVEVCGKALFEGVKYHPNDII